MVVQFRSEASNALPTYVTDGHVIATTYVTHCSVDQEYPTTADESDATVEGHGGATGADGGTRINTLWRIQLPERPDPSFGDLSKVVLNTSAYTINAGTNQEDQKTTMYLMTHDHFTTAGATWAHYDGSNAWAVAGGDYDSSSDWGFGSNGQIQAKAVEVGAGGGTIHAWDLSVLCVAHPEGKGKFNWGDSIPLLHRYDSTYDGSGTDAETGYQYYYDVGSATKERPWVEIYFANPPPEAPFISVIPDEDGIDPKVQVDKHSTTPNLLRYSLGWDNVATNIEHGGSGVDMTDSDAVGLGSQPTIWPASKMTTTTLLDAEDTAYSVFIVAEHTHNQDTSGSKSNQVTIARPNVDTSSGTGTHSGVITTGSTVAATKTVAVGEEVEIRIKSTSSVHSGKIKRFWINWEANISDTADDYGQFDVDENVDGDTTVSTKNFTHVYDRDEASNFTIKVQVEDEVGFRSNSTLIATITVSTPVPVAKLTASRETAIEADKADINNTVVVSGQHSYAVGSNRYIKGYKYKHDGGDGIKALTAFPTANDNSVIYDAGVSQRLSFGCSIADCGSNSFRIYGVFSVNDAGGDVSDLDADFSHYRWGYETISSNFALPGTNDGDSYFKHVSYVVCTTTVDTDDSGGYYSVVLRGDNDKVINDHISVDHDNYKWGGYYGPYTQNVTVDDANGYELAGGRSWREHVGIRVGDKLIVSGHRVAANNGTKTVIAITGGNPASQANICIVAETLTEDGVGDSCVLERDTSHIVSVPVAGVQADVYTITHDVIDDNAQTSATASTQILNIMDSSIASYTLTTDVDAGNIAILNTTLSRSGGLTPVMTAGDRRYPLGLTRTKLGLPTLTMNVRIMTNEGLRNMWSLVEGDRFAWVTLKKHLIDAPEPLTPYRTLRLKPISASLSKTPTDNKDYTASLTFVVMGEDI